MISIKRLLQVNDSSAHLIIPSNNNRLFLSHCEHFSLFTRLE